MYKRIMYKRILLIFASVICVLALSLPEARAFNLNGWGGSICSKLFGPPICKALGCVTVSSWGTGAGNTCVNPVIIEVTIRVISAYGFCQNRGGNWRGRKDTVQPVSLNFAVQQKDLLQQDALGPDQLDFRGRWFSGVLFPEDLLYDVYGSALSDALCKNWRWSLVPGTLLPSYFWVHIEAKSCEDLTVIYTKQDTGDILRYTAVEVEEGEGDFTKQEQGESYVWDCGNGNYDIVYDRDGELELSPLSVCADAWTEATAEGECKWTAGGLPIKGDYTCRDEDIKIYDDDGNLICDWPCPPEPS